MFGSKIEVFGEFIVVDGLVVVRQVKVKACQVDTELDTVFYFKRGNSSRRGKDLCIVEFGEKNCGKSEYNLFKKTFNGFKWNGSIFTDIRMKLKNIVN